MVVSSHLQLEIRFGENWTLHLTNALAPYLIFSDWYNIGHTKSLPGRYLNVDTQTLHHDMDKDALSPLQCSELQVN